MRTAARRRTTHGGQVRPPAGGRSCAAYAEPVPTVLPPLVVGFDLDMTLVDTRPGIAAVLDALAAETGVEIDSAAAVGRLGPPLDDELARWFAPDQMSAAADRFRALYPGLAVQPTPALPGAHAAIDAVHRAGGRVVVVTG